MKTTPQNKPAQDRARKRILIVDDHPLMRKGLVQLLNSEPDLIVCGEAEDARQALDAIGSARPDLVLADITLPGKSGLGLLKDMQLLNRGIPVLVLSMHDENIYAERMLRAGARGYIMKSEDGQKLLDAVRRVLRGEIYLSENMSGRILRLFTRRTGGRKDAITALSDREFEIFQLLGEGLTSRQIGERLHLSAKTVETHRLHIREKLKLRTGTELVRYAIRWSTAQHSI